VIHDLIKNSAMPGSWADSLEPFVCAGLAACTASSFIHPIDLAKVRIQLIGQGATNVKRPGAFSILKTMIANEGITSIYSGLSAAYFRQASYGTARIGLHTYFSAKLVEANKGQSIPFYMKALSGMTSGAIAVIIGTPFDVALVRMQADSLKPAAERRGYKNAVDAVRRIGREEGIRNLWRGVEPNILRGMAMNAGMMATYDQSVELISGVINANPKLPSIPTQLGASAIAGFACAFASLPFDMVKSRLQYMKADAKGVMPYTGVMDCGSKILKHEGVLAFWRGFGAYYARSAPHAMIVLLSREQIIKLYRKVTGGSETPKQK